MAEEEVEADEPVAQAPRAPPRLREREEEEEEVGGQGGLVIGRVSERVDERNCGWKIE